MRPFQSYASKYRLLQFHEPDRGQTANDLLERNPIGNRTRTCGISGRRSHQWRQEKVLDREEEQGPRVACQVVLPSWCGRNAYQKGRPIYS